jgi:hypothetical protein
MVKVKESSYRKSQVAIHFGRTVRHVSLGEAMKLGCDLINLAWAIRTQEYVASKWRKKS